jgi:beta-glucosidase
MQGKTYRFFSQEPLYPFGYGLSLYNFQLQQPCYAEKAEAGLPVKVQVTVTNSGKYDGEEIVQLYLAERKSFNTKANKTA